MKSKVSEGGDMFLQKVGFHQTTQYYNPDGPALQLHEMIVKQRFSNCIFYVEVASKQGTVLFILMKFWRLPLSQFFHSIEFQKVVLFLKCRGLKQQGNWRVCKISDDNTVVHHHQKPSDKSSIITHILL
jgi:hypothetical protein